MRKEEPGGDDPIESLDWRKALPFNVDTSSEQQEWLGLQAASFHKVSSEELSVGALDHHRLVLFVRPPEELDMVYGEVKRHSPPPMGSILLVPAGSPAWVRSNGRRDVLHVFLEAELVTRVAAETFDLDPARLTIPPINGLNIPHLRAAMQLVHAELTAKDAGEPLIAESLANVLAVHLIRQILTPRQSKPPRDGMLPKTRLRAVVEYIDGHLDNELTLEQIAAVAHLSPYHFARQFKATTGLPPHQFVIVRRVERAKELLQGSGDLSVTQVASRSGFFDQGQLSRHFKRLVGVTPGQFRRR